MSRNAMIRPAWTPATIGLMVLGFVVFWPLGLAMLAYILWGDRLEEFKAGFGRGSARSASCSWGRGGFNGRYTSRTGNVAFDDWREAELKRLDEERRKLDEMYAEFEEYSRELRRAKDQEEFNSFMSRRGKGPGPQAPRTVPEI
jgi:hypothetical protein